MFDACGVDNSKEVLGIVLDKGAIEAGPDGRADCFKRINRAVKFILVVLGGNTCSSPLSNGMAVFFPVTSPLSPVLL